MTSATQQAPLRRMAGEDAGFLALERPGQPMTNLYLVLLKAVGEAPQPLTLAWLRGHLAERLDLLPALRWRMVAVPFGLHHPVYVDDPGFRLDNHVSRIELAPPGGARELDRLCGRLAGGALDRRRPLWDLKLVDGLEDGRQALIWRAHHCLMDGAATMTTLSRFFAGAEDLDGVRTVSFAPRKEPSRRRLLADAMRDHARGLRRLPFLVRTTGRGLKAKTDADRTAAVRAPRSPADVPVCVLNDAFGPGRTFSRVSLAMSDFKLVREASGAPFSDVALAVTAGALRRVLVAAGDLPERPLVAGVPVSFEPPDAAVRQFGNRFANLTTSLATDVEDPWERLAVIRSVASAARRDLELVGTEVWEDWLDLIPPCVMGPVLRYHYRRRRSHRDVANLNVTISNVRGPASPYRLGPAEVEEIYLNGPPNNGFGSVVALFSHGDRVHFGTLSVTESLPDPEILVEGLRSSLAELVAAAAVAATPAGLRRRPTSRSSRPGWACM